MKNKSLKLLFISTVLSSGAQAMSLVRISKPDDYKAIVGRDDRVPLDLTRRDYSPIGVLVHTYVQDVWGLNGKQRRITGYTPFCTAFMIGKTQAMTAGHCVIKQAKEVTDSSGKVISKTPSGQLAKDDIYFLYLKKNGEVGQSKVTVSSLHSSELYKVAPEASKDFAWLSVDTDVGSETGFYTFESLDSSEIKKGPVLVEAPGYSGDRLPTAEAYVKTSKPTEDLQNNLKKLVFSGSIDSTCHVHALISGVLYHDCDIIGGSSGGPILYRKENGDLVAVGLNSQGVDNTAADKALREKNPSLGDTPLQHFEAEGQLSGDGKTMQLSSIVNVDLAPHKAVSAAVIINFLAAPIFGPLPQEQEN
jgi:V8-like Glu-specific endopeptidase